MHFEELSDGGLRVRTPAKLNLYLEILGRRDDGYHELDSVFQTISLYDTLEFRPTCHGKLRFEEHGMSDAEDNLVYRAATLVRRTFGVEHGVDIALHKSIPSGAGLGGGSSDAAATLVALTRLWSIDTSRDELSTLGAQLGSDVPFFLHGGTARCRGRGEIVTPYGSPFGTGEPFHYVLASPDVHLSTADVYRAHAAEKGNALTLTSPLNTLTSAELHERLRVGGLHFNRLERPSRRLCPVLDHLLDRMRSEPFVAVRMTGSGSTFYGLCRSAQEAEDIARRLASRFAGDAWTRVISEVDGTEVDGTEVDGTEVDGTEVDGTEVDGTEGGPSNSDATERKAPSRDEPLGEARRGDARPGDLLQDVRPQETHGPSGASARAGVEARDRPQSDVETSSALRRVRLHVVSSLHER